MSRRDELIMDIIDREWNMFKNVNNIGSRASCQEDYATFLINRMGQAESWSEPTLQSYLSDLETAEKEGRSLLSEKYARMMASTSPADYKQIAHLLPPISNEVHSLVDQIVYIVLEWEMELASQYPNIVQRGRPLFSSQDTPTVTSLETYLRGELLTYSLKTLELYYDHVQKLKSESINGSKLILEFTVKQYGYASLKQANEKFAARS
jgi:hypothetical protein